ncbi:MAG: AMP-binding protein [Pirellulales bacterium]|nr:AMP-binding protein [Pirellulales bacterium]
MSIGLTSSSETLNVAARLDAMAGAMPDAPAIVQPIRDRKSAYCYKSVSFAELREDTDRIARGLVAMGVAPGMRLVLMVPPSIEFVTLTFALLKSGAAVVLIDPGMGRKRILSCLEELKPDGFVGIPIVQAIRTLMRRRFPSARFNVTVGRRWFWGGKTLNAIRRMGQGRELPSTKPEDHAAIIFTTGSTGPPKGVLYRHGNFDAQVQQIKDQYDIEPGGIDLPGFPLFALFNCAMGVTTVVPDMNPTRPADVDPEKILRIANDCEITQAFGSPAMWRRVGGYCAEHDTKIPTLRKVFSAGAPVPPPVIANMKRAMAADGELYTPYGATESLPVASISGSEVLNETASKTNEGRGTCVGRRFSGIDWKVIRPVDGPIQAIEQSEELPVGEVGELIVRGAVVTTEYVSRTEHNATSKIVDGQGFWHRMGDLGYFDEDERFWFCGRKAHLVTTAAGPMYPVCCEAIFNVHPSLRKSALVGVGPAGKQLPALIIELEDDARKTDADQHTLFAEMRTLAKANSITDQIETFLVHPQLPVDIRHNSKIFREKLAVWAAEQLEM